MSTQLPSVAVARYTDEYLRFVIDTHKRLRDDDRRRYRRGVIWLVVYQIVVAGPVRISLDTLAHHKIFSWISPFIIPSIIALVLCIWGIGLLYVFGRKYK